MRNGGWAGEQDPRRSDPNGYRVRIRPVPVSRSPRPFSIDSAADIPYHDGLASDKSKVSARREASEDETVIAEAEKLGRRPQITLGSDACTFLKGAVP